MLPLLGLASLGGADPRIIYPTAYLVAPLSAISLCTGLLLGFLTPVGDFVWQIKAGQGATALARPIWAQRIDQAWQSTREIVGKVWLYVIVGIAVGAGIHSYVPEDALVTIMGRDAW